MAERSGISRFHGGLNTTAPEPDRTPPGAAAGRVIPAGRAPMPPTRDRRSGRTPDDVLEHVGMVVGMETMAIAQHGRMLRRTNGTVERARMAPLRASERRPKRS